MRIAGDGPRILLVEDEADHAALVCHLLRRHVPTSHTTLVDSLEAARATLDKERFDVVLGDLALPDARGDATVRALLAATPSECPLIVLTADGDERSALAALQEGAQDYLDKSSLNGDGLRRSILYALERQSLKRQLRDMAHFDSLTGLLKRQPFRDEVERSLRRVQRNGGEVALMFIDVDRFKEINDLFGHEAGDELLSTIGKRLRTSVRESDLVARLGGDEFAVLLEEPIQGEVEAAALRVLETLRQPLTIDRTELCCSASIGIAQPHTDSDSVRDLFRRADAAMYQAKAAGRNGFRFFDHKLHAQQRHRQRSERMVRSAVARQEFDLYYQPIVSLETGVEIGAEALMRWLHPTRGVIAPEAFIDALERQHLLGRVGGEMLERTCEHLASVDPAQRLPVSVNVAAAQLEARDFASQLARTLDAAGIPPRLMQLEITESTLIRDLGTTRTVLEELSELGVRVAVDDFGTGYSSLAYLRKLPVHSLKIDRCFVSDNPEQHVDGPIVSAIVQLGHALGCNVVAEGIETAEQALELRRLGCDAYQGFWHSRPMPARAWQAHLAQR